MGDEHVSAGGLQTESDGFVAAYCSCGWRGGPFPDEETAIDALMEHAYEMGRTRDEVNADERALLSAAAEIIAVGGNGEGWTLNDALDCLRVALGDTETNDRWTRPVDRDHLARIVGDVAYYIGPS